MLIFQGSLNYLLFLGGKSNNANIKYMDNFEKNSLIKVHGLGWFHVMTPVFGVGPGICPSKRGYEQFTFAVTRGRFRLDVSSEALVLSRSLVVKKHKNLEQ